MLATDTSGKGCDPNRKSDVPVQGHVAGGVVDGGRVAAIAAVVVGAVGARGPDAVVVERDCAVRVCRGGVGALRCLLLRYQFAGNVLKVYENDDIKTRANTSITSPPSQP